jgi:CRP/FNR family cyclic AMP-dependent transcriptional regulator
LTGKVKASRITEQGMPVILDIYKQDEFFGECAILGRADRSDVAVAYEKTQVMVWTASEIEELSRDRPKLAIAMMQLLAQRAADFAARIESFSVDNIERRLARSLIRFADRCGWQHEDGSTQMGPLTHEFLGLYTGTSREIITQHMNYFRRKGYVQYSRKSMSVRRDALQDFLKESG